MIPDRWFSFVLELICSRWENRFDFQLPAKEFIMQKHETSLYRRLLIAPTRIIIIAIVASLRRWWNARSMMNDDSWRKNRFKNKLFFIFSLFFFLAHLQILHFTYIYYYMIFICANPLHIEQHGLTECPTERWINLHLFWKYTGGVLYGIYKIYFSLLYKLKF